MDNYRIRKVSNGELRRKERILTLNVDKYCSHKDTLYFDVEGEKDPYCFDINAFYTNVISLIQQGLVEDLIYDDGVLNMFIRDGNVYTDYLYDFNYDKLKERVSAFEDIKIMVYKIVSFYNDNPIKSIISTQKYMNMIFDIIDGDRLPEIKDENVLLRIFEVYNANKKEILLTLLQNVELLDENGNAVEYGKFVRTRKLMSIKYDILQQMEIAMLIFAVQNGAQDLYSEYMADTYIQPRKILYKYMDENGNLIDVSELQKTTEGNIGTIAKGLVQSGYNGAKNFITQKGEAIKKKIKERKGAK